MRAQIAQRVTLDELAALLGLSVFHFCRSFKVSTGLAPQQWLQSERMRIASKLLSITDDSVNEIARMVGYESQSHFSRLFRRTIGECPSHFRKTRRAIGN
jgi:AraC family transcriptional regulator